MPAPVVMSGQSGMLPSQVNAKDLSPPKMLSGDFGITSGTYGSTAPKYGNKQDTQTHDYLQRSASWFWHCGIHQARRQLSLHCQKCQYIVYKSRKGPLSGTSEEDNTSR